MSGQTAFQQLLPFAVRSRLAYVKFTFVLGWTAPNGIAMCHDEVVASLI